MSNMLNIGSNNCRLFISLHCLLCRLHHNFLKTTSKELKRKLRPTRDNILRHNESNFHSRIHFVSGRRQVWFLQRQWTHLTHKWRLCPAWRRPREWTGDTGAEGTAQQPGGRPAESERRGGGGGLQTHHPPRPARTGPGLRTGTQRQETCDLWPLERQHENTIKAEKWDKSQIWAQIWPTAQILVLKTDKDSLKTFNFWWTKDASELMTSQ